MQGLLVHSHKAHSDKWDKGAHAFQIKSINCPHMNDTSLRNRMGELRELSAANNAHLIGIFETLVPQTTDQGLAIPGMSLF